MRTFLGVREGDANAARLITIALQQAVTSGTARQLVGDGLGRLQPAGALAVLEQSGGPFHLLVSEQLADGPGLALVAAARQQSPPYQTSAGMDQSSWASVTPESTTTPDAFFTLKAQPGRSGSPALRARRRARSASKRARCSVASLSSW